MTVARNPGSAIANDLASQLKYYETHSRVFTQVTDFYSLLANTISLYILASGGIWTLVLANLSEIGRAGLFGAAVLHLFASAAAALVCIGVTRTILQRLDFLQMLGAEFWPSIVSVGEEASVEGGVTLRKQAPIWPFIPVAGGLAGLVLAVFLLSQNQQREALCQKRLSNVENARPDGLSRATFLFNNAGCGPAKAG